MTASHLQVASFAPAAPRSGRTANGDVDHAGLQRAAAELRRALGADPDAEGLEETSALHGLARDDARIRQEFLALTTRTTHDH